MHLLDPIRLRDCERRGHLDGGFESLLDPAAGELVVRTVRGGVRVEHDHRVVRGRGDLLLHDELPRARRRAPVHRPRLVAEDVVAERMEVLVTGSAAPELRVASLKRQAGPTGEQRPFAESP